MRQFYADAMYDQLCSGELVKQAEAGNSYGNESVIGSGSRTGATTLHFCHWCFLVGSELMWWAKND